MAVMEGVVLESLQVLLSSLRVVAQKAEMTLERIGGWADPPRASRQKGTTMCRQADACAVQASGGLHHTDTDTALCVESRYARHTKLHVSDGTQSTGPTDTAGIGQPDLSVSLGKEWNKAIVMTLMYTLGWSGG
jgi:hypothetical protein